MSPAPQHQVAATAAAAATWDDWYSGLTMGPDGVLVPVVDQWERCWAWLCDQAQTQDEAMQRQRPWPERSQLTQEMVHAICTTRLLQLPKSRRRFASWAVSAVWWWRARFHPYSLWLIQSLDEGKAGVLIEERVLFMEENLRERVFHRPAHTLKGAKGWTTQASWKQWGGGTILAVKEGGDAARSYTLSGIFLDEVEFQPHAPDAFRAMTPLLEEKKNTWVVAVSTMNGPGGQMAGYLLDVGFTQFS